MITRLFGEFGGEQILVTRQAAELIPLREYYSPLGRFFAKWHNLKVRHHDFNGPPPIEAFRPKGDFIIRADVRSGNPFDYKVMPTTEDGITSIRMLEEGVFKKLLLDDWPEVRETAVPSYLLIEHFDGEMERLYRRVTVPLVNADGAVEMLYSATREYGILENEASLFELAG